MANTQSLSITLSTELAERVKAKVASGEYASESEVVSDGLLMLLDEDAADDDPAIERWLREEVAPAFDEMETHPERKRTPKQVDVRLDALAATLSKQAKSA